LEGTLNEIIRNNLAGDAIHVALAEDPRIKPVESQQYKDAPDPHCWFSIPYVKVYTDRAMQALIQTDQIDLSLGSPEVDPHGKKIPRKEEKKKRS